MPANLTPEYLAAERKWKVATSPADKLAALQEMLATIPKHKGTDKMQADLKRRIAKAREEMQRKKGAARQKPYYHVEKEGAGQLALVGPPNSGKSSLVGALTHAAPEIAAYPFTTRLPLPGMAPFENIQMQLVDMPPLTRELSEGWHYAIIRTADAAVVVLDLAAEDLLDQTQSTLDLLEEANIHLHAPGTSGLHGPGTSGLHAPGRAAPDAAAPGKPAIVAGTRFDLPEGREQLPLLEDLMRDRLPVVPVSPITGENLDLLLRRMFESLGIIRVYSKPPGRKADLTAPFVLPCSSTVLDAAEMIHKDFVEHLKYARLWGRDEYSGQMVSREHALEDGDVLEIHV